MYKGKYINTITQDDVANPSIGLRNLMGKVLPSDIGKQVWENKGNFYVENDEQRDKRLAAHKPDYGRIDSVIGQLLTVQENYIKEMDRLLAELDRARKGVA